MASLETFPVVVVTGARQAGKSTLVRHGTAEAERAYLSLDDPHLLDLALQEPDALLRRRGSLTRDEVQGAPDLLRAVKRSVDARKETRLRRRGDVVPTAEGLAPPRQEARAGHRHPGRLVAASFVPWKGACGVPLRATPPS